MIERLLSDKSLTLITCAFILILPYPTTQFDTINTCMGNFQDILKQRELPCGPLWYDQGVYKIAR